MKVVSRLSVGGIAAILLLSWVSLSMIPVAHATSTVFECTVGTLLGANETPPNASPATGFVSFTVDTVSNTVSFTLAFSGLTTGATAAHIHQGLVGVAGPVEVPLPLDGVVGSTSGTVSGTGTPIVGFNVADIVATPSGFYVNVHSTTYPGGEIRGQVIACTPLTTTVPEFSGILPSLLVVALVFPLIVALKRRSLSSS